MDLRPFVLAIANMRICSHDGARVQRCNNYFDDEDAFELFEALGIVLPDAKEPDREWAHYTITLARPTLEAHLADHPPAAGLERRVIACFIRMASDPRATNPYVSNDDVLPIAPTPMPAPERFLGLAGLLADEGYCTLEEGKVAWLQPGKEILHELGLWVDGEPPIYREMATLAEIWATMPLDLRRQCIHGGHVNMLILCDAMRKCWSVEAGWHPPLDNPRYNDLYRVMDTARQLASMVNAREEFAADLASDRLEPGRPWIEIALLLAVFALLLALAIWLWGRAPDPRYGPHVAAFEQRTLQRDAIGSLVSLILMTPLICYAVFQAWRRIR